MTHRLYRPSTAPDRQYFWLLWEEGIKPAEARKRLDVKLKTAEAWTLKLRREACETVGRSVSVVYALRLLFAPEEVKQGNPH